MFAHSDPTPAPWESTGRHAPHDLARLRAIHLHRKRLARWYPEVPVPGTGFRLVHDHPSLRRLRLGTLLRLWERWPEFGGACPACGHAVLGLYGEAGLATGRLGGVCLGCALVVTRWIGSFVYVVHGITAALGALPVEHPGDAIAGDDEPDWQPLRAVLGEVGEAGLSAGDTRGSRGVGGGDRC